MSEQQQPVACGCGGRALYEFDNDSTPPYGHSLVCSRCASSTGSCRSKEQAIESFNTARRPSADYAESLREDLKQVKDCLMFEKCQNLALRQQRDDLLAALNKIIDETDSDVKDAIAIVAIAKAKEQE